jgi:hypothetical protein
MNDCLSNPWPYGKGNCVQCGQLSGHYHLCPGCFTKGSRESKARLMESVKNGTFDQSGEIAADLKAFHGDKGQTFFDPEDG